MLIIFERLLQWCNTQPRAARVLTRRSCLGGWDKSNEADNIMIEMSDTGYRNILSGLGLVVRATVKTETGACNLEATHTGPLPSSTGQAATVDRLSLLIQVNHHNQIQKLDYTPLTVLNCVVSWYTRQQETVQRIPDQGEEMIGVDQTVQSWVTVLVPGLLNQFGDHLTLQASPLIMGKYTQQFSLIMQGITKSFFKGFNKIVNVLYRIFDKDH